MLADTTAFTAPHPPARSAAVFAATTQELDALYDCLRSIRGALLHRLTRVFGRRRILELFIDINQIFCENLSRTFCVDASGGDVQIIKVFLNRYECVALLITLCGQRALSNSSPLPG